MFRGDAAGLDRVMWRAPRSARNLGHCRVVSEHVLFALVLDDSEVTDVLSEYGVTAAAIQEAACAAAPSGASAVADRRVLATIGVDPDCLLDTSGVATLDRPAGSEPVFALGANGARRRCAQIDPPMGVDVQATHEASLRLALARRERQHRSEHLALTLVTLDSGVDWALSYVGVDREALLADRAASFPPPKRNLPVRTMRWIGHRSRHRDLVWRYQHLTGRMNDRRQRRRRAACRLTRRERPERS